MTCYSKGLRERAIKYLLGGHTPTKASKVFNVGKTALWRWKKQLEEQGNQEDKPRRKYFKKVAPQKLEEYLAARPDAYLYEIGEVFGCSSAAVSKALKRMGYTNKKNTTYKEQDGQKVAEYIEKIATIPQDRLVYIDETGIDRYMYRARAWSRRGRRVHEKIRGRRYMRAGIAAALCCGKIVECSTTALWRARCLRRGSKSGYALHWSEGKP